MALFFIILINISSIFSQSLQNDSWNILPELYEEIVVDAIDSEVKKLKIPKDIEEPLFGASAFDRPLNYNELLKRLRKKRNQTQQLTKELSWEEKALKKQKDWIDKSRSTEKKWIEDKKKVLEQWSTQKSLFNKSIDKIKKTLIPHDTLKKFLEKEEPLPGSKRPEIIRSKVSIISQSFHFPIKFQGERGTCASFAAVRGLEIKLKPSKKNYSEHFFHYLSRPDCQDKKCSNTGSWARVGLKSLQLKDVYLPTEKDCPYIYEVKKDNITHIPLKESCYEGNLKVNQFTKVQNVNHLKDEVEMNNPVVIGFYVDDLFLKNDGFVRFQEKPVKKEFAHTVLAIGILPLSKNLVESQGRFCLLVVNSWGSGWGIGGHSCLSEKWVNSHKIENPALAINSIQLAKSVQ